MSGSKQNSNKHLYDDFFDQSWLRNQSRYFHYYIGEDYEPMKIRMKIYEDEDMPIESKTLLLTQTEQKSLHTRLLEEMADNEIYQDSLLEVPVSQLRREILESISEERANNDNRMISEHIEEANPENPENPEVPAVRAQTLLWTDKYLPNNFFELLSEERLNREVLTWLKAWDPVVFKRKINVKSMKNKNASTTDEHNKNQKMYINYDLEDGKSREMLQNKVILLCGPPGTGKTTLARVIAKVCGYNPIEINASDERTANVLIEKIDNVTKSETLKTAANHKPSLLILDEVDGTTESEYSGAITRLMKYIYGEEVPKEFQRRSTLRRAGTTAAKDDAANGQDLEKDVEDFFEEPQVQASPEKKGATSTANKIKIPRLQIKRPIIFICNDPYSRSLKELRKRALIFNFKKPDTTKLMKRLHDICRKEKLMIDHDTLNRICEQNGNDIRGCLNMMEFLSRKRSNKLLKDEIFMVKKEMTKNLVDVIEDIIRLEKDNKSPLTQKKSNTNITTYCLSHLQRNTDYDSLSEGLFGNYSKMKNLDAGLRKVTDFLDSLVASDTINRSVFQNQHFELLKYTNLCALQAHISLAHTEKVKVEFPRHIFELKKNKKYIDQFYDGIHDAIVPRMRTFYPKRALPMENVSFIYQIMQPKIDSTIVNLKEKEEIENAAFVMMDFGFDLVNHSHTVTDRQGIGKIESKLKPALERLLMYDGVVIEQRFNDKLYLLLQSKFNHLKAVRASYLLKLDSEEAKATASADESMIATLPVEEQFICPAMESLGISKKYSKKRKTVYEEGEPSASFLYKYKEGFSNAVRYDVKMNFFFSSFNPASQ